MISTDTAILLLKKYYPQNSIAFQYLHSHSVAVAELAVDIALKHPELSPDIEFIRTAALLHDIGIFMTHAPKFGCFGDHPYLAHGYLGRELLEREGYPDHALVCERHVGVGITKEDIMRNNLPLPPRDMVPLTIEEEIVCYADKFFSKDSKKQDEPIDAKKVKKKLARYGSEKVEVFQGFVDKYGLL